MAGRPTIVNSFTQGRIDAIRQQAGQSRPPVTARHTRDHIEQGRRVVPMYDAGAGIVRMNGNAYTVPGSTNRNRKYPGTGTRSKQGYRW